MKSGLLSARKLKAGAVVRIIAEAKLIFIQQAEKMEALDFDWKPVSDLPHYMELSSKDGVAAELEGVQKEFEEAVTLAGIGGQVFTPEQVEKGCLLNLGTNDSPMVFHPFFAHPDLTIGTLLNRYEPYVEECIQAAKKHGAITGTWRRILFDGDRGQVFCD
jgi:hypothetical protein